MIDDHRPRHGGVRRAPRTDLEPKVNRSRAGTEPISARKWTDLDAEIYRSRRSGDAGCEDPEVFEGPEGPLIPYARLTYLRYTPR